MLDGIIAGVGSVIKFMPNILILFFCIALFEDTGYMARSAFLMDKIMHLIGLHGKSFIPMLMGFGCNVPAIMAARTLESEKDRILTILITPFMSCSAKLPVYVVLAGAFFGPQAGTVIFGLYLLGIVLSILTGRLFRSTLLARRGRPLRDGAAALPHAHGQEPDDPHVGPQPHVPAQAWARSSCSGRSIIWALSAFPQTADVLPDDDVCRPGRPAAAAAGGRRRAGRRLRRGGGGIRTAAPRQKTEQTENSYIGRLGRFIEPVFAPLGIDWRGGVSLLSGFVAKEIVVSTMGVLYATGDGDEEDALERALAESGHDAALGPFHDGLRAALPAVSGHHDRHPPRDRLHPLDVLQHRLQHHRGLGHGVSGLPGWAVDGV